MITVIVPVRREPPPSPELLCRLRGADVVVAATSDTSEETLAAWESAGARVVRSDGPRGQRLQEAARQAKGELLLFLHADTLLPERWAESIQGALGNGAVAGAFRLAFVGGGARLGWVAFWANLRTRLTRVPYGDQAPFARADVYWRAGGHKPWPLLEDVALGAALKREGPIALLPDAVLTSPRRYLERGVTRTVLRNWKTLLLYRLGRDPDALADAYRRR